MSKRLWSNLIGQARLRRHGCYTAGPRIAAASAIERYRLHTSNIEARFGVGCLAGRP